MKEREIDKSYLDRPSWRLPEWMGGELGELKDLHFTSNPLKMLG